MSLLFGSPRFVPHTHACSLLVASGVLGTAKVLVGASITKKPAIVVSVVGCVDAACRDAAPANVAALERARESPIRRGDTHRDLLLQ